VSPFSPNPLMIAMSAHLDRLHRIRASELAAVSRRVLGTDPIQNARVNDASGTHLIADEPPTVPSPTVCHCLRVTTSDVETAISVGGCRSLCDVMQQTDAGRGCTACHRRIKAMLNATEEVTVEEHLV